MLPVCLAVDVQGGDYGSKVFINGILEALKISKVLLKVYLCGNKEHIIQHIDSLGGNEVLEANNLIVENCRQSIDTHEIPSRVWKTKKESSVIRCLSLQKEGIVKASLSAGDTRILMGASIFLLGRSPGVSRPALAALLPTTISQPALLLDVGANLNCRTEHLVAFGIMGFNYVKNFFSKECPSVALLNVGKESSKGTNTVVEAAKQLTIKCQGYCGFIEGARILSGDADVIVCDGFLGNVLLKACESFHVLTESVLKDNKKLVVLLKEKMAILNAENYGAVPLLGLNGIVLKAHGSSSSKAITRALLTAVKAVEQKVFVDQKALN